MTLNRYPLWLRLYRHALKAYPLHFRIAYREQAFLTALDWFESSRRESTTLQFYAEISRDLVLSLVREHSIQLRRTIMKRPIVFHTAALICVLTALGFGSAIVCQQMLRRGANEPQQQMVETYANKIMSGAALETAIPENHLDLSQSLEPFLAFYDEQGRPLRSTGYIGSAPPIPPAGVFAYLRSHGSHAVTWQPRAGIRLATVARKIEGPRPGFLLAGRSLRVVEEYENTLRDLVLSGWLVIVFLLVGGAVLLNRATAKTVVAG